MLNSQRKFLIAGNWKMNKTSSEAADLAEEISQSVGLQTDVEVVICPPFTALQAVAGILDSSSNIKLGAQNMYPRLSGAYTGEVSPEMLRELFCSYVILGHSERRQYFAERDEFINEKVRAALGNNLRPILCVGETLEEREAELTPAVVRRQIDRGLDQVTEEQAESLVIAYEPVWAIGTGRTATPEMAQETHNEIRKAVANQLGESLADKIHILYGGSMKPENAGDLLEMEDIDGGLIGGAALEARSFIQIIEAARGETS